MFGSIGRMRLEERILILIGVVVTYVVFYLINFYFTGEGLIWWALVETGIMWIIIFSLHILSDNQRVLNDELKEIIREHIEESRTLKSISQEQLSEMRILKELANEAVEAFHKRSKKSK